MPAIATTKLVRAEISTASKNVILQKLTRQVALYNALDQIRSLPAQRIRTLDEIMITASAYVTSKPPQPKHKNRRRWAAVEDLLDQCGRIARGLGGTLISGPDRLLSLNADRAYWLERVDPHHRLGEVLGQLYPAWIRDRRAIQTKQSFWSFVGEDAVCGIGLGVDYQVQYCDASGSDDRKYLEVKWKNGKLYDYLDDPYCTEIFSTHWSGNGWAIFVADLQGRMYAYEHVVGQRHHSIFTSGAAVTAAGELVCENGIVRVITAKSGHYKPSPELMLNWARRAPLLPGDALILPDWTQLGILFRVSDFRRRGFDAEPVDLKTFTSQVPGWAKSKGFLEIQRAMQAAATRTTKAPFNYVYKPQRAPSAAMSNRVSSYGSVVRKGSVDQTIGVVDAPPKTNYAQWF
ncbi:MAG: hypothetical protein AAGI50_00505 [Pseudomonadota bacterium]